MCGIGGRTIAEAQQRISHNEFLRWSVYRSKRGSLNQGMRIERGTAMLAVMYANAKKEKPEYDFYDFAVHHDRPPLTLEQAMSEWG